MNEASLHVYSINLRVFLLPPCVFFESRYNGIEIKMSDKQEV
jgi:hypothetical protein